MVGYCEHSDKDFGLKNVKNFLKWWQTELVLSFPFTFFGPEYTKYIQGLLFLDWTKQHAETKVTL
jgi:hypothetical protein